MKLTVSKVKRTLEKDYGWSDINHFLIDELIKDVLKIISK